MKYDVDDFMTAALSRLENKLYWVQQKAKMQPTYFNGYVVEVNYVTL
jgi:hypothetical protein